MSKKSEILFDGITQIDDAMIENALKTKKRRRKAVWFSTVAAVLAAAILIGVLGGRGGAKAHAIAVAAYPEATWRTEDPTNYMGAVSRFAADSIPQLLTGGAEENRVCSPVNLYMALSMLAEVTAGDTQGQILDLLAADSVNIQRERAGMLWNNYNREGEGGKCVLANSLWLNRSVGYVQETMDTLARDYYASSYSGEMGDARFDRAIQKWINEQTGGRLQKQASGIVTNHDTLLEMVSTVYFRGKWHMEFDKRNTAPGIFRAPSGELTCDFMHQARMNGVYYWGERFGAVQQYFKRGFSMWYILPDEGVSPADLLTDAQTLAFLAGEREKVGYKPMYVNLTVPKFDVSSDLDLREGLWAMGVRDAFDWEVSDFSPMTRDVDEVYLAQATQAARVTVDEEGCVAAAYVQFGLAAGAAAPPTDEIDFTLDRPFLFVITGNDGLPLFVGIVNRPIE